LPPLQPPGVVRVARAEARQHRGDPRRRDAERMRHQCRAGGIGDVVARATAQGQRHRIDRAEVEAGVARLQPQAPFARRAGGCPRRLRGEQEGIAASSANQPVRQAQPAEAATSSASSALSTSSPSAPRRAPPPASPREVGQRMDAVFAEMVGADVGDDGGVGARDRQAAPQQPPRAVSRIAVSRAGRAAPQRAPAGPDQSPLPGCSPRPTRRRCS
jgi:hypothetical protein